jgi:hypothetical protein
LHFDLQNENNHSDKMQILINSAAIYDLNA